MYSRMETQHAHAVYKTAVAVNTRIRIADAMSLELVKARPVGSEAFIVDHRVTRNS